MPGLTEERPINRQVWPQSEDYPQPQAYAPQAQPQPQAGSPLLENAVQTIAAELQRQRQAGAIQRKALLRVLNLDEGALLAAEKAIVEEQQTPATITSEHIAQTVQDAIKDNNETILEWMGELATWMKKVAPEAPITDPLHPNYQPAEAEPAEAPKNVIDREPDPMKELNEAPPVAEPAEAAEAPMTPRRPHAKKSQKK